MAYWTHTETPIGQFVEKEAGNYFEFSNNDADSVMSDWPHKVWVGGLANDQGYRYAMVKQTVVYIVTDEDEYGVPVVEKWAIKNKNDYVIN